METPSRDVDTGVRQTPLTGEEIFSFYENGFLKPGKILRNDELELLRESLKRVRQEEQEAGREMDLLDPKLWPETGNNVPGGSKKTVGFLFNLWMRAPEFRELAFRPLLAQWAASLIGSRQVRLLEDNALYKEPRTGGELMWHQDYPYWPLAQPNAVTLWIALDDVTVDNGAMWFAKGSHLTGERLPVVFGTGASYGREMRPKAVREMEDPRAQGMDLEADTLKAGEVSIHHSLLWHASGPNDSPDPRRALVIRYVADGTIWLGSRRYEYNYSDEEVGINFGDPIGGKYFPLVEY